MGNRAIRLYFCVATVAAALVPWFYALPQGNMSEIQSQKKETEKEIAQIKGEIGANQKAVKESLGSLKKIEARIEQTRKDLATVKKQIEELTGKIETLEGSIAQGESELKFLRGEYLKAVKKMRVAKKKSSDMAFVFASKSFSQAERRMRYMKEFSSWKTRQQDAISAQVAKLKEQHAQLTTARQDMDVAYKRELTAQAQLKKEQEEQTQIVAGLRANGAELKQHLSRKQAEARKLANQISELIAQEQAKEAERKRKEAEAKAAEERRLAEAKAAAEKKAAEEKAAQQAQKPEEKKTKETKPKQETSDDKAETRRRKRSDAPQPSQSSAQTSKPATSTKPKESASPTPPGSDFASMKGQLPRPVSGSFRIVSAFGVHPVSPDLPDIMDENLGIDAHVGSGAAATAVFPGEVIKIYDRTNTPGFRNIVVVKHGDYITVYANLENLSVHAGQTVRQGQTLGTVGTDFDDPSQGLIHFEVWKGQTRQDPAAWIK